MTFIKPKDNAIFHVASMTLVCLKKILSDSITSPKRTVTCTQNHVFLILMSLKIQDFTKGSPCTVIIHVNMRAFRVLFFLCHMLIPSA